LLWERRLIGAANRAAQEKGSEAQMIVHLNGWPGVGKLTVGRELTRLLGGRLLDNHTLLNPAAALAPRASAEYWSIVREFHAIAHKRMREMPPDEIFVLTNALAEADPRATELWAGVKRLARERGDVLLAVTLDCSLAANLERIDTSERTNNRKLDDPAYLTDMRAKIAIMNTAADADFGLRLDTTDLSAPAAARVIFDFARARLNLA
jgi:hypothetical protein